MEIPNLFVYGTLMHNIQSTIAQFLHRNSDFIGEGSFPGKLYDVGSYPGAIYDAQASTRVYGHIFRLQDIEIVLKRLDFYEGIHALQPNQNEYRRELVPVDLNHEQLICWVYLYNFTTDGLNEIIGGHYLHYLEQNETHQHFLKNN